MKSHAQWTQQPRLRVNYEWQSAIQKDKEEDVGIHVNHTLRPGNQSKKAEVAIYHSRRTRVPFKEILTKITCFWT